MVNKILNDDKVIDTFVNLYCRWQDEWMYEDIEEYGEVMHKALQKAGLKCSLKEATETPFGCKVKAEDKRLLHFFVKIDGEYANLVCKIFIPKNS